MELNKKPFMCSWKGCNKEFANEDHLNVHTKKHNLAIYLCGEDDSQNVSVADQTPTPTRFIRNCEELGLFQDLQNVNPFDETFRKATEFGKNGMSVSPEKSEDTLHTPHIFTHVKEENISIKEEFPTKSIDNKLSVDNTEKCSQLLNEHRYCNDKVSSSDKIVSSKIGASIKKTIGDFKICVRVNRSTRSKAYAMNRYSSDSSDSSEGRLRIVANNHRHSDPKTKQRQREMNREAQIRSRAKKKYVSQQLLDEVNMLKRDKKSLLTENKHLKDQITFLKTLLSFHKDCPVSKDPTIQEKVKNLLKTTKEKYNEQCGLNKPLKPILPNTQKYIQLPMSPLLFQYNNLPMATQSSEINKNSSQSLHKSSDTVVNQTSGSSKTSTTKRNCPNTPSIGSNIIAYGPPILIHIPAMDSGTTCSSSCTPKTNAGISTHSQTETLPNSVVVEKQSVNKISKKISKRKKYTE